MENESKATILKALKSRKHSEQKERLVHALLQRLQGKRREKIQAVQIVNLDPRNAIEIEMMPGTITWDRSWEEGPLKFHMPLGE